MANEDDKQQEEEKSEKLPHILTIIAFICILFLLPLIIFYYIAVRTIKKVWMKMLAYRFPHLDFVETDSIRTLLDTHRNQGIINVLMTIKGTCDPVIIRQALIDHLLNKKDRAGNLRFPKLQSTLISCWGNYAWYLSQFSPSCHIIEGSPKFRGRPINDYNYQDYVSDIVSKFLPVDSPPWQVVIIPNIVSSEPKYGLLIRVHHILLEEQDELNIGDFLLLKPEEEMIYSSSSPEADNEDELSDKSELTSFNPLCNILEYPTAIPSLYYRLCDSFSNRWNEFISDYDPIESPKMLQKFPGVFHCVAIFLITFATTCKEFGKYVSLNRYRPISQVIQFISIFHREAIRRGLTPMNIFFSGFITFNPLSIFLRMFKIIFMINLTIFIRIPLSIYFEYMAFISILKQPYCLYPNTYIALFHDYLPLIVSAVFEIFYMLKLIYLAPMTLIQELFLRDTNNEEHQLQIMSTCGRKVIAWSQPVSRKWIHEIARSEKVSDTEVLLAMTTSCLKEYFQHANLNVPDVVLATARSVSCDTLLASYETCPCSAYKRYGMVYLTLPVGESGTKQECEEISAISNEMIRVRENQGALYALSGWRSYITQAIPSVVSRVALNYGSRKYAVAITEVAEGNNGRGEAPRVTRWGHPVSFLICWRPPQGNISMSLTIQSYGGAVRLGVMTDALITPHHHTPARHWPRAARRFHAHHHKEAHSPSP